VERTVDVDDPTLTRRICERIGFFLRLDEAPPPSKTTAGTLDRRVGLVLEVWSAFQVGRQRDGGPKAPLTSEQKRYLND
jgi:hypothetical protein